MSKPPVEPPSWADDQTPDEVARAMREQLDAAKRRMRAYRDEMEASGLAIGPAPGAPDTPV
ncbi:MAG: hypothetical protein JWP49_1006 [Phenylobacterium sp.]|jgi:hypothetical protein|nr:hypothetical protein [Phenylobacterium sp.]